MERLTVKPKKAVKTVTFDVALGWLRRGKRVRRRGWHPESCIFRLGDDVFVKLPDTYRREPQKWSPYPHDFLASDWLQVR